MLTKTKILAMVISSTLVINSVTSALTFTPEESIQENLVIYQQLGKDITELNSKISALNIEIEQINSKLEDNNAQLSQTKSEIENTKELLAQNENDIKESQLKLDSRIRSIYKSNLNSNFLVYIITSDSISDLLTRLDAMKKIVSLDKATVESVKVKQEAINKNIDKLQETEKKLNSLNESILADLKVVDSKKLEQQSYLDNLNAQKDDVFAIIEENEKKLIEHPVSIINSSNSTTEQIQTAIATLQALIPQLNSDYVIDLAEDAIYSGGLKVSSSQNTNTNTGLGDEDAKATYTMESTAYTGGGFTAMGLKPVRDPNGISTVAVDPTVIPLGSKVYVSGYGVAIASDTGGAIKGNKIDVYLNSYDECISWGRRTVTVEVLAYPGEW